MTIQDYLSYDTKSTKRLVSGGTATIKKREGRQLKAGGLWIYDNEIDSLTGDYENGDILSVLDFDGYFLGYGFVNTASTIRIRMLARRKEDPPLFFMKGSVPPGPIERRSLTPPPAG